MAIQIPNPGTGNGATGDNEFVLWSKVKDNFSDKTNAASRLVGESNSNLVEYQNIARVAATTPYTYIMGSELPDMDMDNLEAGQTTYTVSGGSGIANAYASDSTYYTATRLGRQNVGNATTLQIAMPIRTNNILTRRKLYGGSWTGWELFYTSGNTTIVNGSLKPSSPVVKIHTDSLELNGDAERMGVTLNKRGVGDYLLQNTTGLRNDGGWRIELPQDVNGNPYFAVAYNELENNDIEVKTYKRIFDMNTFMFVPDLENPVDIKEGRSIAIRFNDLPQDDIQPEEVELDK